MMIISYYIDDYIDSVIHDGAVITSFSSCTGMSDIFVGEYIAIACSELEELVKGVATLRSHIISTLDKTEKAITHRTDTLSRRWCGPPFLRTDEEWKPARKSFREQTIVCRLNKEFLERCSSGSGGR